MTEEKTCIDAIQSGDPKAVWRLVRSGVDINTRFNNGYTLLHLAVLYGNDSVAEDVLEYWTEAGGDVNVKTSNGNTPLHLAVTASLNSSTGVVAAVCRAGADLHVPDSCGKTPLELAISRGHNDVADYLIPRGSSSTSVRLTSTEQTSSVHGDWLSDYIQELPETCDQPWHEEMRKWIIDEIPWLYGVGPQAEAGITAECLDISHTDVNGDSSWQMLDTITRARLSKIKKLQSDMSAYPQICQLLQQIQKRFLSAANVVIPQDQVLDFVGYLSYDEETATNDYGATLGQDMEPADRPGRVNESCAEASASTPGNLNKAGSSSTSGAAHSSYSRTLEEDIQWLLDLFDRHEHEEIRNCVINEIPRLVGMDPSPQAEDDALMSDRSLEIRRRLIVMSMTDDQSRQMFLFLHQLLMLRKKQKQKPVQDDEMEFVDYPSDDDDEENDTDDEMGSSSTSGTAHSYSRTLEEDILWLFDLYDRHEHEEVRNCVINEIPRPVGMDPSPQAEDDALMSARLLEIRRRLIEMSFSDDQSRHLLMLMKEQKQKQKQKPVQEDGEPESVVIIIPSDDDVDEENDTDEMDGQHLERTEHSLQEPVTELEALENRSSLHINHD